MSPGVSVGRTSPVSGTLVQMMSGTGFSVSCEVSDLGGMNFGGVMRSSVSVSSVSPWGSVVSNWSGNMSVRYSWSGNVMSIRDSWSGNMMGSVDHWCGMCVVGNWSGMSVMGNWMYWSWSNGQVGSCHLETVNMISCVLDRLHQTVSIDV